MTDRALRTCARVWCFTVLGPDARPDGYCSSECARINCLVPEANDRRVSMPRRARSGPTCPGCGDEVRTATLPGGGRVTVDPEPHSGGRYVLNGGQIIAVLDTRQASRMDWDRGLYAEHDCPERRS